MTTPLYAALVDLADAREELRRAAPAPTEEIMRMADEWAFKHLQSDRDALNAAVEKIVQERRDFEVECEIHALCTRAQRERAEGAERLLRDIFRGLSDHDQEYWLDEMPTLASFVYKEKA